MIYGNNNKSNKWDECHHGVPYFWTIFLSLKLSPDLFRLFFFSFFFFFGTAWKPKLLIWFLFHIRKSAISLTTHQRLYLLHFYWPLRVSSEWSCLSISDSSSFGSLFYFIPLCLFHHSFICLFIYVCAEMNFIFERRTASLFSSFFFFYFVID